MFCIKIFYYFLFCQNPKDEILCNDYIKYYHSLNQLIQMIQYHKLCIAACTPFLTKALDYTSAVCSKLHICRNIFKNCIDTV